MGLVRSRCVNVKLKLAKLGQGVTWEVKMGSLGVQVRSLGSGSSQSVQRGLTRISTLARHVFSGGSLGSQGGQGGSMLVE